MNVRPLLLPVLAILTSCWPVLGDDHVPLEKAQEGARALNESLGQPGDLPLATTVDLEKPQAIKAGEIGLMVVPDQGLSAEALKGAGSESIVPLGQLWTLNLVVGVDGQASAPAQQRTVVLRGKDRDFNVNLYLLGVARNAAGALELIVYGRDKEPITRLPLAAGDGASQSFPIEMEGRKEDDQTGWLALNILGQHHVELLVKRP